MNATKIAYRHFYRGTSACKTRTTTTLNKSLQKLSKRTHVYDKRHYHAHEDYLAITTARPWDHMMLRLTQRRLRRWSQYMAWLCSSYLGIIYLFYTYFVYFIYSFLINLLFSISLIVLINKK